MPRGPRQTRAEAPNQRSRRGAVGHLAPTDPRLGQVFEHHAVQNAVRRWEGRGPHVDVSRSLSLVTEQLRIAHVGQLAVRLPHGVESGAVDAVVLAAQAVAHATRIRMDDGQRGADIAAPAPTAAGSVRGSIASQPRHEPVEAERG